MEWEEEWNKGMRDIYMQTCLGGIENVENIVGGGKCMEECANRLSRTKFCGNKTHWTGCVTDGKEGNVVKM